MHALLIILQGLSSLFFLCASVLLMSFVSLRYEKRHSND